MDRLTHNPRVTSMTNVAVNSGEARLSLQDARWEWTLVEADAALDPRDIQEQKPEWWGGQVKGTLAADLKNKQSDSYPTLSPEDWETRDVWYCVHFPVADPGAFQQSSLILDGLATIADVWLNDCHILHSENMFLRHELNVSALLRDENCLYFRFSALEPRLKNKKPRPKWRTPFANRKNLNWIRTSLLGRISTWSPPPPIIGSWLPAYIIRRDILIIEDAEFQTSVMAAKGLVSLRLQIRVLGQRQIEDLQLQVGEAHATLTMESQSDDGVFHYSGNLCIEDVDLWWPHTHGKQPLYEVTILAEVDDTDMTICFEPLGFRTLLWRNLNAALDGSGESVSDFGLDVNGVAVFCRGACWTPISIQSPAVSEEEYREALGVLRDAGVNMLRVSGTFFYEQDSFYRLCDELGILIWQDFMFSRLAYPFEDDDFLKNVMEEVQQVLTRLRSRCAVAIFCGNTEVEQQVAMLGLPLETEPHTFFRDTLADICRRIAPQIEYWPSSPAGGELPFQINRGVSHYFGVGGYLRPLEDAQVNEPLFASECLAFSNVPENRGPAAFLPEHTALPTDPTYKAGVPRDVGTGWDFADVTDHYIERIFSVDTRKLRYEDPQRYLSLARVTSGEIMATVMGYWRRQSSACNGAIVWFLRDLESGAGWGLIDAEGFAKSPLYYLKRAWAPLGLWFVSEGLNGLRLHASNESAEDLHLELEICRYQACGNKVDIKRNDVSLSGRGQQDWNVESWLGAFFDATYSYRFGPEEVTIIQACLRERGADQSAPPLVEAFYYPRDYGLQTQADLGLKAWAEPVSDGCYRLSVSSQQFSRAVVVNAYPFSSKDNYFDMGPGSLRQILLVPVKSNKSPGKGVLRGSVKAFNGRNAVPIIVQSPGTAKGNAAL